MGLLAKTGLLFALAASNAQADIVPTIEEADPHHGNSFQVDVPCAEQAVRDFLGGNPSEFNSEVGLITATQDNTTAIVALHGERAESDLGFVSWIDVSSINEQAHIGLDSIEGPYISATSDNEADLEPTKSDVQELENHLRTCGRQPLMS